MASWAQPEMSKRQIPHFKMQGILPTTLLVGAIQWSTCWNDNPRLRHHWRDSPPEGEYTLIIRNN